MNDKCKNLSHFDCRICHTVAINKICSIVVSQTLTRLLSNSNLCLRGCSQFTFTLFSRFLTTHLPLVYIHLHLTDHLPICKRLHMNLDHPYQNVPQFSYAHFHMQGLTNMYFLNPRCNLRDCKFWSVGQRQFLEREFKKLKKYY